VRGEDDLLEHAVLRQVVGLGLVGDLALDEGRAHVARAHGDRGDAVLGPLERERLDQSQDAVLGRDVGGLERRGGQRVSGGHDHEAAVAALA